MGQITLTLPSDGTTIEAADVNNPFNTLLNEFNGNIDDNNIKTGANINGTKLLANSLPPTVFDANSRAGWLTGILSAPNTVTPLGNRNYQLIFNTTDYSAVVSAGARLRTTRTSVAPNQCTTLNGSTQYFSKSAPAGMTFTDDFAVSAWVKLTSYGANSDIATRYDGSSGWIFRVDTTGRVTMIGNNAGAANFSYVQSSQSVPLNKWVHVAAQLDMSAFTATTTTSYAMIDGVDVAALVGRAGTNPTALVQAGNLNIGGLTGVGTFPGKVAQVAIYSAKVTQATILASMHQSLTGSETSVISVYTFNNEIVDKNTTNANNLTANGSAVATSTDSPYGGQADGTISTTLDYGIVQKVAFSTNTTITVQVPEGCTIPTSGGVSALAYSNQKSPFGMPVQLNKWAVETLIQNTVSTVIAGAGTWVSTGIKITVPLGSWNLGYEGTFQSSTTVAAQRSTFMNLASGAPTNSNYLGLLVGRIQNSASTSNIIQTTARKAPQDVSAAADFIMYTTSDALSGTESMSIRGDQGSVRIYAENAYL